MPALLAAAFVFGTLVGSFLNVVIARVPEGRSIVTPPSACPACGSRIRFYDNVPIVSWLVLRGRCRACGKPISPRYPLVEGLTGVVFAAVVAQEGLRPATAGHLAMVSLLLALSWIDLDTWLLPYALTLPLLGLGLLSPLWDPRLGWGAVLGGAALGAGVLAAIALFGERVLHKEVMGWGDVWLLGGIGAWEGWGAILPVLLLSSLQGALVGGVLLALGRKAGNHEPPAGASAGEEDWVPPPSAVPFGPFLALGAFEVLLLGDLFGAWFGRALGLR